MRAALAAGGVALVRTDRAANVEVQTAPRGHGGGGGEAFGSAARSTRPAGTGRAAVVGSGTGSPKVVRIGTCPAHTGQRGRPRRRRDHPTVPSGIPRRWAGRGTAWRQARRRWASGPPWSGPAPCARPVPPSAALGAVGDLLHRPEEDHRPVVHRVVERGSGPAPARRGSSPSRRPEPPRRGPATGGSPVPAVHVEAVTDASVGHREHDRTPLGDRGDVSHQRLVEHRLGCIPVERATVALATQARPVGLRAAVRRVGGSGGGVGGHAPQATTDRRRRRRS